MTQENERDTRQKTNSSLTLFHIGRSFDMSNSCINNLAFRPWTETLPPN